MNLLTDILPDAFEISGAVYPINWDFRTALLIMEAFEDKALLPFEKQCVMLNLLYGENIPEDTEAAMKMAVKFLDCGESHDDTQENQQPAQRLYSFTKDANYIFTAINQTHGIDLQSVNKLHWWKFCFLFQDISEDCFFSRLIYLRKQKAAGKLTKEEWQWYNSIRDIAELDGSEIDEDPAIKEFMALLEK